ncbi:hypothetical protein [Paraclostridium bifermentans]|uniref:hypothetical protein n=1 Tax=Paraclostridium bifermentans TaxID=1490 RepID=UPI001C7E7A55|nr:hypothetical protein [Paraclostridium bifermentans]GIM32950.1 hypothetical protein PAGU1678_22200 [Paraclostridium bifermentans subsp. muricolitidis]
MEISRENVDIFLEKVSKFFNKLRENIRTFFNKIKKSVLKLQIHKYWDNKELRSLVYIKQKVKTKRLKKKYDNKINRFIFRQMQLKV